MIIFMLDDQGKKKNEWVNIWIIFWDTSVCLNSTFLSFVSWDLPTNNYKYSITSYNAHLLKFKKKKEKIVNSLHCNCMFFLTLR